MKVTCPHCSKLDRPGLAGDADPGAFYFTKCDHCGNGYYVNTAGETSLSREGSTKPPLQSASRTLVNTIVEKDAEVSRLKSRISELESANDEWTTVHNEHMRIEDELRARVAELERQLPEEDPTRTISLEYYCSQFEDGREVAGAYQEESYWWRFKDGKGRTQRVRLSDDAMERVVLLYAHLLRLQTRDGKDGQWQVAQQTDTAASARYAVCKGEQS